MSYIIPYFFETYGYFFNLGELMKVYAVGTSCTWFTRKNTSFIIDDCVLFDTPSDSYKEIIRHLDIFSLKAIVISHFHFDHFGDLRVFVARFMRESEKRGVKDKFKIYCPKGTLDKLIEVNKVICAAKDECDRESLTKYVDFIEVYDGDEFNLCDYKVKVYKMEHADVYCQGYTFTDKNGDVVAFSADTNNCENLNTMLSKAKIAFVDMAADRPVKAHLDIHSFMELEKKYTNCKMFAVHTSDKNFEIGKQNGLNVLNDGDTILI